MAQYFYNLTDEGNVIQISDDYRNLAFINKVQVGTAEINSNLTGVSSMRSWSLTVTGNNPIIAVGDANNCILYGRSQSGNNFTFTGVTVGNTSSFIAYIFDYPTGGGSGPGLVIRNVSGELVFDSNLRYMKVAGMVTERGTFTYPANKTYAALLGVTTSIITVAGGPVGGGGYWLVNVQTGRPTINISGNTITAAYAPVKNWTQEGDPGQVVTPTPGTYGSYAIFAPILDVTGL